MCRRQARSTACRRRVGLSLSLRHVLQVRHVQRLVRHDALQSRIFLFQLLQSFRLIDAKSTVRFPPAGLGLLGDLESPSHGSNCLAFGKQYLRLS